MRKKKVRRSSKKSRKRKAIAKGEIIDKKVTGVTNKWIINKDRHGNYRYYRIVMIRQRVHPTIVPVHIKRKLQSMLLQKELDKRKSSKKKSVKSRHKRHSRRKRHNRR